MLTPDYLAHSTDVLLGLYDELDRAIISDISRRIVKTGRITESAKHQINKVQESGMLLKDVTKQVSNTSGIARKEVERMFEEASVVGMRNDAKPLILNGIKVDLNLSASMQQVMDAAIAKTNGDLRNLTMTLGVTASGKYQEAVNAAYMKVQSGAFSYTQAIKDAIREAASDGNWVSYQSGHRSQLDVAVRRSVLTGLNQTAGKLTELYGADMGCEYYETSAHAGARPSHSVWQGRVFKIEGASGDYPNFADSTGYGTGEGLCGWNCRHSFYPYFPGLSVPAYTKEMLDWYDAERYEYNGDRLTEYEVSQLMRRCERNIRSTKRELAGYQSAMDNTNDGQLKAELQDEFDKASVKLKRQKTKYSDLCSQTNHKPDTARTGVVATKDGSGNIISFNRSTAQKARWANTRVENNILDGILNSGNKSGALNPDSKRASEHAERYYGLVRSMSTDVNKIAKATGFTVEEIQEIKNHIFMDKHDLGNGKPEYFEPSYSMAQSWQRLMNGKPEPHDLTLLNHEKMERLLMKQGMTQDEAHILTSKKYNYAKEADEYYDKIKKHSKK